MLVQRAGLELDDIRLRLTELKHSPEAHVVAALFSAARNWSITHRQDPEFLTDVFLLAVLSADKSFLHSASEIGLDFDRLESLLIGKPVQESEANVTEPESPSAEFALPD